MRKNILVTAILISCLLPSILLGGNQILSTLLGTPRVKVINGKTGLEIEDCDFTKCQPQCIEGFNEEGNVIISRCDQMALGKTIIIQGGIPTVPPEGLCGAETFRGYLDDNAKGFEVIGTITLGGLDSQHAFSPVEVFIGAGDGERIPTIGLWGKKNDPRFYVSESWANGRDGQGHNPTRRGGFNYIEGGQLNISVRVFTNGDVEVKVGEVVSIVQYGVTSVDPEPFIPGSKIRVKVNNDEVKGFEAIEWCVKGKGD